MVGCCALLAQGCTVIVSPDEAQCSETADCVDRGFANASCVEEVCVETVVEDPIWGCLGNVVEPEPDPTQALDFPMKLVYASGDSPLETDAVIDICDKIDFACTGTDPKYPKGLHPDSEGNINIEVFEGFDGFVQITHVEIVDTRVYVGRPIIAPPGVKEVRLLRPFEYEVLAGVSGENPDPTRGTVIAYATDCQGEAASGVRFESPNADSGSTEFYLINQSPAVPPTATATDGDGFGGFFNLAAGSSIVRTYRDVDDEFIGESSFQILGNTISFLQVAPTPQ